MEKYRRWTDQTAGINPFVAANAETSFFLQRVLSLFVLMIKGSLFLSFLPTFIFFLIFPLDFTRKLGVRVMLLLMGVYDHEDYSLEKAERKGGCSIILSNHTTFIDILYFIYRFPSCVFLGFNENRDGNTTYFTLSPLSAILSLFISIQLFYKISDDNGFLSLKELLRQTGQIKNGGKLVVFYQKVRTNGRGTIRIDKELSEQIYELERDIIVTQIKYTPRNDTLCSVTSSPLSLVCTALSSAFPGNNMKVRATRLDHKDMHSANELREGVNSASTGPLLETSPKSYYEFIDFYRKTQRDTYKLDQ